jgi:hypothetical protein
VPKFLLVLCLVAGLHAESPALRLKWDELAGAVNGKHVSVNLKDGSSMKGIASGVAGDSLVVVASGRKSEISIPRDRITGLQVTKMRIRGRVISTVLGAMAGLVAGTVLVVHGSDNGFIFPNPTPHPNRAEQVAGFGMLVGVPVGAYFIGRSLDRHEVSIILSPSDTSH